MKTNIWNTAKGTEVTLDTQEIKEENVNIDGHEATVRADRIEIKKVTVGGQEHRATLTQHQGKNVLHLGYKKIDGKEHPFLVLLPEDVYQDVWGEYDARKAAALKSEMEAKRKYQEHYNKVMAAMAE